MKSCILYFSMAVMLFIAGCSEKLPASLQADLDASVAHVEGVNKSKGRFPKKDEFDDWSFNGPPTCIGGYELKTNSAGVVYYTLSIWRGERMLEYSSLDKKVHERE